MPGPRLSIFSRQESVARGGEAAAIKALELDPDLSEAHVALGERRCLVGPRPEPNDAIARHGLADYLIWTGNLDESVRQVELGRQADPLSPLTIGAVNTHLSLARRYDEAIAQAEEAIEFLTDFPLFHGFLSYALWQQGSYERTLAAQRPAGPRLTRLADVMEPSYRQKGPRAAADFLAAQSETGGEFAPLEVAGYSGEAGKEDLAFEWLQKALDARTPQLFHLKADPYFDSLRSDPRHQDIFQRIGSSR